MQAQDRLRVYDAREQPAARHGRSRLRLHGWLLSGPSRR